MKNNLERGRDAYRRRAWGDAYTFLLLADQAGSLSVEDLELLANAAYLSGRDVAYERCLDRAYQAHLGAGEHARAARSAFWLCLALLLRGQTGQANAWLARGQRLIEGRDRVEGGYLLLPVAEVQLGEGEAAAAHATASRAAEVGDRFGDGDLSACARHLQSRALIRQGRIRDGLVLLDEAMLAAVAGELSPIMTGLIYCSLIEVCRDVHALSRAREWTAALGRWCEQQAQMVAFTNTCLVRRAEILTVSGAWSEAMSEVRRVCDRVFKEGPRHPPASALYQKAELHRLQGEYDDAEKAYLDAARLGRDPQPGLALLRMAQGRLDAAAAAIRRAVSAAADPVARARLLPAHVEIMLATGDLDEARDASRELEEIASAFDADALRAAAVHSRGAIELAAGEAHLALRSLRCALDLWRRIDAPYEVARGRLLIGFACASLGDAEGARLERDAARAVFEQLGCAPEIARLESTGKRPKAAHGLTPRELQVIRLIAAGKTNKAIAAELFVSERTVDRHVSNILGKLNAPSRAAAAVYAHDQKLL